MVPRRFKSLLVAAFSVFSLGFSVPALAQHDEPKTHETKEEGNHGEKKKGFNASEVIFGHVLNAHEFHFLDIGDHPVTIPLPVILYMPGRGFTSFMSSKFEHGHKPYGGYALLTEHKISEWKLDPSRNHAGEIVAINEATGLPDMTAKVYDLSLTRNVVQMLIALGLFVFIMLRIAKRYKSGVGVTSAPKGSQSLLEPVITFIRDEVAKPNLGPKYGKYLPYLLTVFFFILINNIFGLVPGSANVTGNIAFTIILGVISFVVILFSSNKHYWAHIFNPPVPAVMKPVIALVEFIGAVFTKPASLIIRLFANMLAGHIIIICLISLIFIFGEMSSGVGWGFSPVSIAFTVFIYLIEILVAFIQAFIFTNLTAVFIGQAMEGAHHHDEAAAHH